MAVRSPAGSIAPSVSDGEAPPTAFGLGHCYPLVVKRTWHGRQARHVWASHIRDSMLRNFHSVSYGTDRSEIKEGTA